VIDRSSLIVLAMWKERKKIKFSCTWISKSSDQWCYCVSSVILYTNVKKSCKQTLEKP